MSETKKRNMRTRKEKTVARKAEVPKAEVPKAEATTAGIAFGASDGGITTGVSNGISVGAYDSITTGISNGSAVGISDGMVADITRGISVGASDGIPDVIATSASEGISDGTSAGVSATIGASVPSAIPAGVPAAVNQTCGKGLKELTAEWMQLERKTLEQRKDAARFYDEHLMKPIEDEFVRNNQDMVFEDVEYMVISVGTSYEPIVLDIQLLKPAKILFLYTETSQDTMAKVIGYCGLSPNRYDKSLVSEVDPMDTYREIKSFYLRSGKPGKMYIDFTGGTKAMSAAATLAGFSGATRWIVYATTPDGVEQIAFGAVYIRPLVSRYRAVVAAVETALQNYGNNPNKTITVGELSITYKDYADLLSILAYWRRRADEDETGQPPKANGPKFAKVRFV